MERQENQKTRKILCNQIIRRAILIFMGFFLGVNIYLANARGILGRQMPMPFGYGIGVVLSGSMEPSLSKNDLIIVKESKELQVNDIVVYEAGKQLVVHRVIQIEGNEVTTQGDANNAADEPFSKDKVLGTVRFRIAGAGRWVTALRKPWVMLLLIAMVFALEEYFFQKQQEKEDEELVALQEEIRKLKENSSL